MFVNAKLGRALLSALMVLALGIGSAFGVATLLPNGKQQFFSGNGVPLAGGFVYMYFPATSICKTTWQDSAQTIPNACPIVLDANGEAIIYGSGTYRQVVQDANTVQQWDQLTADTAGSQVIWAGRATGTPNAITVTAASFNGGDGQTIEFIATSTNTGAVTLNPSSFGNIAVVKDTSTGYTALTGGEITSTNVITVVYDATNAVFHIQNLIQTAVVNAAVPAPQGYLNLLGLTAGNGSPIQISDVSAATTVYYSPFIGNQIPIWSGSQFVLRTFGELTLTLTGSQLANTIYDVCVFNNAGTLVEVTGPAWTNSGAGTSSRGAPAALTRLQGIWVNSIQITGLNGATSYTIPANQCTYVGSIYTDNTAGQVTAHRTYGQNRKFGVWNAWNRQPIYLKAGDATASWTYANTALRASNGAPASFSSSFYNVGSGTAVNGLLLFSGLPEDVYDLRFIQKGAIAASNNTMQIGIAINTLASISGKAGWIGTPFAGGLQNLQNDMSASFASAPAIGINAVTAVENTPGTSGGTQTFFGTENYMLLSAWWKG